MTADTTAMTADTTAMNAQVDGPSMFPTFPGKGEWVLAEALPGLADRVQVGACNARASHQHSSCRGLLMCRALLPQAYCHCQQVL
jgi:hypothetical protein